MEFCTGFLAVAQIKEEEFEVLWEMLQTHSETGMRIWPRLSRYLLEREKFWHRWIGGLRRTDKHINILWADKDPIAILKMGKALREKIPSNTFRIIPNVGHYPMLEAPEVYAENVVDLVKSRTLPIFDT